MIKSKTIEKLERSRVRLSVTIDQENAKKKYAEITQEYAKKARIKGFRPGKVPFKIIEQKFGENLCADTAQQLIEESLKTIYAEIDEKPLSFATPLLESNLDFSPGQPFSYILSYDIFPQLNIEKLSGFTVEEPQVSIGDEAITYELAQLQQQNAIVVEKSNGMVEKTDIVTIDYYELDADGKPVPDSQHKDYTFTAGNGNAPHNLDDVISGMKVNEEKHTNSITITVKKIKSRELPEIDDELAQDVDDKYTTLDDLKKDLSKQLTEKRNSHLRKVVTDVLLDKIIEANPIVLPESMVRAELDGNWQNLVREFGGAEENLAAILKSRGDNKDQLYAQWRPNAERRLCAQLVMQKLIEDRKIEASEEETGQKITQLAEQNHVSEEKLKTYYENNKMMEYLRHDILEHKLIDQLLEENMVKKGKKIKYLDFMQVKG